MRAAVRWGLVLLGLLCASGCGYTTRRLDRPLAGARSIAVLPFRSPGFRRDLDLRLTRAVATEIRARTSYALATDDRADLLLEGVMDAEEDVVLQRADREVVQRRLLGTTWITITERRTGRVVKRYPVYASVEFVPLQEGQSLEGSATEEWTRRVAIAVVQGLEPGL